MADALTVCAALMVFFGFSFLFWFIRRLGILQIEAARMPDDFERPKPDPQPMVEVKNPFKMAATPSRTLGCVEVIISCMYPCHISCYWKIEKQHLDKMVYRSENENEESDGNDDKSLQSLLEENCGTVISRDFTDICTGKQLSYNVEDIAKELPLQVDGTTAESQIYHVVITMELTEEHKRSTESPSCITSMLTGVELVRENANLKPRVVQQFIQTKNDNLFRLKKLFLEESTSGEQHASSQSPEQTNNMCIVCQTLPISRALIPCGHACLCSLCFDKMNSCPMCREPMTSCFVLREEPNLNRNNEYEFSEILKRMNPVEIIKGIYNAS